MRRRRAILAVAALSAAACLRNAHAQRVYRVAVLSLGSERASAASFEALRAGLKELGYIEGKNLRLSARWNESESFDHLPDLAAELLRDKPDVFVSSPVRPALAIHKLTRTVPIVLASGTGAVQLGLAISLARPGGNVTGMTNQGDELAQKQIELLKAIVPGISRLGVLTTGLSTTHSEQWRGAQQAAQALKLKLVEVRVGAPGELSRIASVCGKGGCQGLLVMLDPYFSTWRPQIIQGAARSRLPAIYFSEMFTREGGLISYGADIPELWRRAASFVDKILRGANPGELPIEQPTKFELVVNVKAAKALGLTIPQSVLVRADKVIE